MADSIAAYWLARFADSNPPHCSVFTQILCDIFTALTEGNTVIHCDTPHTPIPLLIIGADDVVIGQYAPIVIDNDTAWLYRTWQAEHTLAQWIVTRMTYPPAPEPVNLAAFTEGLFAEQKQAIQHAACHYLTLINGGPGTGKTFTVARLVRLLHSNQPECKIALAAPTGKAAKRMEESLRQSLTQNDANNILLPPAQTLHRLLGMNQDGVAQYHQGHYLPYDVVIIDEASMLSLDMAHALFASVAPQTRLILLGDADQLAAVDPGAVLHDLSHHPVMQSALVTLKTSSRFRSDTGIARLANLLQSNPSDTAALLDLLHAASDITWYPELDSTLYQRLFAPYQTYLEALQNDTEPTLLLEYFDRYRVLCSGHYGVLGAERINRAMTQLHKMQQQEPMDVTAFHGMPIMVTSNDYRLGIFNGDIGLCLRVQHELAVFFPGLEQPLLLSHINPANWQPAYALTIHKSQGSEYQHIALALEQGQRQSSRELLYTGVTRARTQLSIFATAQTLTQAAQNPIRRSTGLGQLLASCAKNIHQHAMGIDVIPVKDN